MPLITTSAPPTVGLRERNSWLDLGNSPTSPEAPDKLKALAASWSEPAVVTKEVRFSLTEVALQDRYQSSEEEDGHSASDGSSSGTFSADSSLLSEEAEPVESNMSVEDEAALENAVIMEVSRIISFMAPGKARLIRCTSRKPKMTRSRSARHSRPLSYVFGEKAHERTQERGVAKNIRHSLHVDSPLVFDKMTEIASLRDTQLQRGESMKKLMTQAYTSDLLSNSNSNLTPKQSPRPLSRSHSTTSSLASRRHTLRRSSRLITVTSDITVSSAPCPPPLVSRIASNPNYWPDPMEELQMEPMLSPWEASILGSPSTPLNAARPITPTSVIKGLLGAAGTFSSKTAVKKSTPKRSPARLQKAKTGKVVALTALVEDEA